jgi:hypothetical protein
LATVSVVERAHAAIVPEIALRRYAGFARELRRRGGRRAGVGCAPEESLGVQEVVMLLAVGTRVIVESESTERPGRTGTIREVLREEPSPRYRIEWDDGHTSLYTPAAGALQPLREGSPA